MNKRIFLSASMMLAFSQPLVCTTYDFNYLLQDGGISAVRALLKKDRGILNAVDSDKETLLHQAAYNRNKELVQLLLVNGAFVNAKNNRLNTPLHHALLVPENDAIIQLLIDYGADVHAITNAGWSPLHYAVQYHTAETVSLLLTHGANIDLQIDECGNPWHHWKGQTPLHIAVYYNCSGNKKDIIKLLLEYGVQTNTKDGLGSTPLHLATQNDDIAVAQLLLDYGADIHVTNSRDWSPLLVAAENGNIKMLELFIANGANINTQNSEGDTPLRVACSLRSIELVKFLVEHGAHINTALTDGTTPLHIACKYGYLGTAELLVAAGADPNIKNKDGTSPLQLAKELRTKLGKNKDERLDDIIVLLKSKMTHYCNARDNAYVLEVEPCEKEHVCFCSLAQEKTLPTIKAVLEKEHIDINSTDAYGYTLLLAAIWAKNHSLLLFLLENGADPNVLTKESQREDDCIRCPVSPLHDAVGNGNAELMQLLLDHGANVDIKNNQGETPLHSAVCVDEWQKIIQPLVDSGANINACDNDGATPLHYAVNFSDMKGVQELLDDGINRADIVTQKADPQLIHFLLDCGSDINAQNNDGETPLHILVKNLERYNDIERNVCKEIITLLIMRGADCTVQTKQGNTALDLAKDSYKEYPEDGVLADIISLLKSKLT